MNLEPKVGVKREWFIIVILQKEIASLKEQVQVTTPLSIDHTSNIEILQKELAAHKEMVAELRDQLKEKEAEFQVGEGGRGWVGGVGGGRGSGTIVSQDFRTCCARLHHYQGRIDEGEYYPR